MIPAGLVNTGYYSFPSLVQDITTRCVHKFFSLETSLLGRRRRLAISKQQRGARLSGNRIGFVFGIMAFHG